MAAKKDEAKVKFTADTQEFNEEIKKSEQQMKEYRSELKLNSEMMKTVGESADLLQQKQEILSKEYDASEAKVQALTGKLEAASRIWGESSEEASRYRIQLNNARVAQEKIQQEMNKAAQAAQEFEQRMSQAGQETNQFEAETGQASQETQEFNDNLEDSAQEAKKAGDGYTVMKGALSDLAADGIQVASGALKDFIEDSGTASSSFAAMTGANKAEMAEFNEEMEKIYKKGYGESLNDIGDAMAYVRQSMNDLDPEIISDIAENAMVMEDVFGIDVQESIRAVDTLMTTMGLDADEAFDYISKGAQNGLNYSGELADNIAEYAPLWEQAGFSAEDMFTILQNGTESGAYNLDKVNDFVKEFTISLSDGRIEDNLSSFSEETQQLFLEWKDGKKTSKDVFDSVIKDLKNVENQQEALTTASNVWSSLGEDNAMNIITSLNDVNDTYKNVQGTMEDIKQIKYDNVVDQYKTLGRTVMTDLVSPLAEKALPTLENFVGFAVENIDDLIPLVEGLGAAFGTIFVANKVMDFADALSGMTNPLQLGVNLLGGLIGLAVSSEASRQQAIEDTWGLTEEQKKLNEEAQATIDRYQELDEARTAQANSINAEYDYLLQLNDELETLVDENGKVKDGYEDRVSFIVNELSEATGIQMEYINGEIKGYQDLVGEIENVIEKKRAESIAGAYDESYSTAIQERTNIYQEYGEQLELLKEREKTLNDVEEQLAAAREARDRALLKPGSVTSMEITHYNNLVEAQEKAQAAYDETKATVEGLEQTYIGYNATIENYEGLQAAIISGDADDIEKALKKITNNFISAESGSRESLERQVDNFREQYETMKQAAEAGGQGVTQEMVDAAKEMYDLSVDELEKFGQGGSNAMKKNMQEWADAVSANPELVVDAVNGVFSNGIDAANSHEKEWNESGKSAIEETAEGMTSTEKKVTDAAGTIIEGFLAVWDSEDFVTPGKRAINDNASGMLNQKAVADNAARSIANSANTNLGSANTNQTGNRKIQEFKEGALGVLNAVNAAAVTISQTMNTGIGSTDTYGTGNTKGTEFKTGLMSTQPMNNDAARAISQTMNGNLGSADTQSTGRNQGTQFYFGMSGCQGMINQASADISASAAAYLASGDSSGAGYNFGAGFANGINTARGLVSLAAFGIGNLASQVLRTAIESHSPSRVAEKIGMDFDEGYAGGIEKNGDAVYEASEGIGELSTKGLEAGIGYGDVFKEAQEMAQDINAFPGIYDNIRVQYDGLFNMRRLEEIIARYSRKSYSFTINRRELIRAMEG